MKTKRKLTAIGLICSLMILIFGGRSPTTVYADAIEHTHIWATTYDSTNHWEYCTVCSEKRNVTAHVFTETKTYNINSCDKFKHIFTCKCGYNYTYMKPHREGNTWNRGGYRLEHGKKCIDCNLRTSMGYCYNEKGRIGCNNPGTCAACGYTATADNHYLNAGKCTLCKKEFARRISGPTVSYASDYKSCTITFTIKPIDSSCMLTGQPAYGWSSTPNYSSASMTSVLNSDGSRTYTQKIIFQKGNTNVTYIDYGNTGGLEKINGHDVFEAGFGSIAVWQDHQAPVQNDIIQKDQASANGWATIKQLTLSGTEDFSDIVYLTVSDKATGEKYVTDASVPVTDGKYSYTCTPSIEGDTNGRTYVVTAKDRIGNTSTKEFIISKTDGSAPQLKNGTSLTYTDWSTSKNISLSFFDFGAGGVEASLDNQTDYKPLTKSGEYYIWNHSFGNQVGTSEHTIYVKDALGNATSYKLTVGNTDSNVYSVSYGLNGGAMSGQKTSYTVADSFTLPTPTKTGYTFTGWTGSNGTTPQKTVTVNKGTRGNLNYTANWQVNTYIVDVNGVLDGNGGSNVAGYATIDVYINGKLDAENVTDYYKSQPYGAKYEIRYKANNGYVFVAGGNNGVYSGTVTDNISTYPVFKTKILTTTFHRNRSSSDTVTAIQKYTYGVAGQKFSDNGFDYPGYILAGYDLNKNAENPTWSVNNGVAYYWIDNQYPANDVYAIWKPISWTMKYDANGGSGVMANTKHIYYGGIHITRNSFTRLGYSFNGWYATRMRNGKTEYLCGTLANQFIDGAEWYEKDKIPSDKTVYKWRDNETAHVCTYIDNDVITLHAQWSYNPISVKVPQVLTGDHTGKSQFRVKCDDFKAGNIKITVPDSFPYKQTGKADVTATITSKSGNNIITPTNKVCVYDITTKNGLSAGCWQGSFNIGLTLTKE